MNTKQDTTDFQSVLDTLRDNGQPPIEGNGIVVLNDLPKPLDAPTRQPLRDPISESERLAYDVALKLVRIHGLSAIDNEIRLPEWSELAQNRFGKPILSFWSDVQQVVIQLWELKNMDNYDIDLFYSRVRARNDSQEMRIEDWIKIHIIQNAYDLITDRALSDVDLIEVLPENNHPVNKHARDLLRKIPPDEMYTDSSGVPSEDSFVPWVERIKEDVLYLLQLMDYGLESRHEQLSAWRRDRGVRDLLCGGLLYSDLQEKIYELKCETRPEAAMECLTESVDWDYFMYQQTPVQGAVVLLDTLLWQIARKEYDGQYGPKL